jgi:hypothetical protein
VNITLEDLEKILNEEIKKLMDKIIKYLVS